MNLSKERFTDTTYSLAKALHHINIGREYFDDMKRDSKGSVKDLFNNYINKCDFILNSIKDRLKDESREILKKELGDSFIIEAINDKLMHLDESQRDLIENLMDKIIAGEEFEIVKKIK